MTSSTLIKSKLRPPVIGRDTVTRAHLLNRLDYHRPLTLIVAPAGYGKTTLMVDWITHARYPCAWLALDAYDDSLTAFMTYVLAALETIFPGAYPETRALLNSAANPAPAAIARTLVNELDALPHGVVLVLDDYHSIQDPAIQQVMAALLRYQPQTLELVLLTRHDPPLPLSELRARNRITELRVQELRFSPEESKAFLQRMNDLPMDDRQAATLADMTEGWPAGVRMTALLFQQGGVDITGANLGGSGYFATKYLVEEVFDHMAPAVQEFLLRTAHMEQVCAALCAAVIDSDVTVEQCQANLETLTQNNLFVFALDGEGAWYRYHHLFRTVLQHRAAQVMSGAKIAALHGRASGWLAASGQVDAAIAHAVKSGDVQAVADLVRDHRNDRMNADDWAGLEIWRALIPRRMIEQHPQLLILDAWSLSRRGLFFEQSRCIDAVAGLIAAGQPDANEARLIGSELDAMRTQIYYWAGDVERCAESGRRALREAPIEFAHTRFAACIFCTGAVEAMSRAEADAMMADAMHEAELLRDGAREVRAYTTSGFLNWIRADLVRMDESSNLMLAMALEREMLEYVGYARYLRGCARYQQNDLAGAEEDFAAVSRMGYTARPYVYSQSFIGLAATYQAQGQFDRAYEIAVLGARAAEESGGTIMVARAEGFLAHMAFRQGKLDEALRWVAQPCRIPSTMPMPTFHVAPVGRAAILLGLGSEEARLEADELLAELRAGVERHHNTRFLIEVLALQACSLAARGEDEAALDLLVRAVELTIPGQAIRVLADLDSLIGPLLSRLAHHSGVRNQIARIRRAAMIVRPAEGTDGAAPANAGFELRQQTPRGVQSFGPDAELLESLTNRELDVLLLLQERPSNKEIARRLNITPETVKRHLTNIYLKLNVENRRQAIVRARAVGILPPA
jgi:LuxR family maltose regulon positive regulatory protein